MDRRNYVHARGARASCLRQAALGALVLAVTTSLGCSSGGGPVEGGEETQASIGLPIVNPDPVPPGELLGMVHVSSSRGSCSGMLVARDSVLTAAHCFCSADLIGGNACDPAATIQFRDDPASPGTFEATVTGTATIHPSYNPSWVDNDFKHDLALVRLNSNAPAHVPAFIVSDRDPLTSSVRIAGFGLTGGDCDQANNALNTALVTIGGYEDNGQIMRFDDLVFCPGDSGGAILDPTGTVLYGVHSMHTWTLTHGWVNKSIDIPAHFGWVRGTTCSPAFEDSCGKGPICRCKLGESDCSSNNDCESGLVCRQNVGMSYGLPATADVCVNPGPVEGTCGCGPAGFGQFCAAVYNGCNPGYGPRCNPQRGACGPCTCQ